MTFKTKEEAKKYYNQVVKPIAKALVMSPWRFVRIAGSSCEFRDPTFEEARISDYEISTLVVGKAVLWASYPIPKPTWLYERIKQQENPERFSVKVDFSDILGTVTGRIKGSHEASRAKPTENSPSLREILITANLNLQAEIKTLKAEKGKLAAEIELLRDDNKALLDKITYLEINLHAQLHDGASYRMIKSC